VQRVDDEEDEVISKLKKFETKLIAEGFSLIEKALRKDFLWYKI